MKENTFIAVKCTNKNDVSHVQAQIKQQFGLDKMKERGKTLLLPLPDAGYRFSLNQLRKVVAPARVTMFDCTIERGQVQRTYYDFE